MIINDKLRLILFGGTKSTLLYVFVWPSTYNIDGQMNPNGAGVYCF